MIEAIDATITVEKIARFAANLAFSLAAYIVFSLMVRSSRQLAFTALNTGRIDSL